MRLIILFCLLTFSLAAFAQPEAADSVQTEEADSIAERVRRNSVEHVPYRHIVSTPLLADSIDVKRRHKKHFWRGAAETVGFNLGLWSFDRFIVKGEYSKISLHSIKENFKHGFEWDDDHLHTNMFDHPYCGSLYFNAGRSNGYNFWQSELFAIGGSAMWELFMEKEYPSTNDIIATPIGGAALGEVLYRTADLITDDRASGWGRFGRELAGFFVDPMRGFTRIVTGEAWKRRTTSGRQFGIPPISVDLSLGARYFSVVGSYGGARGGIVARLNIEYGSRYEATTTVPYDYFSFLLEPQAISSQPLLGRAEIIGRLLGKEVADRNDLNVNIGLYQHFDYFDSDTIRSERRSSSGPCSVPYKFGTPACVGGGVMARYIPHSSMSIDGYLHFNGVILAGILTDFYRDYHRNYNWGSGFSLKGGLNWALSNDKISIRLANRYYRIYTWNGYDPNYNWSLTPEGHPVDVQGDASTSYFNHFEASGSYRLWNRLHLTFGFDLYARSTIYDMTVTYGNATFNRHQVKSNQFGFHLMLTYKL